MNKENGDNHQNEQLDKLMAQMNVFSQHQKAMAEFTSPKKKVKKKVKIKIMKKG